MTKWMSFVIGVLVGVSIISFWGLTLLAVLCGIGIGLALPLVVFTNDD